MSILCLQCILFTCIQSVHCVQPLFGSTLHAWRRASDRSDGEHSSRQQRFSNWQQEMMMTTTTTTTMVMVFTYCFLSRDVVSAVYATATWLGGWVGGWLAGLVSVTRRYCIKTAKPVLKLFRPSGSPVIIVSSDSCADTQFQGYQRELYIHKCGKW